MKSPYRNEPTINTPGTAGGREYSGHAFDRMQQRGIVPSVVEEAIENGVATNGRDGATVYKDAVNGVSAIVDSITGRVRTVVPANRGCK